MKKKLTGILFLIVLVIIGYGSLSDEPVNSNKTASPSATYAPKDKTIKSADSNLVAADSKEQDILSDSQLTVHFIDIGQGDSTLIECNGKYMLIDAGENDQGNIVVSYLNQIGVKKIDYLIGTHPHSDHIGGLDTVINNFEIGIFIMPKIEHTTKTFEDVLDTAIKKNLSLTAPVVEQKYKLGDAEFVIIAPNDDYKDDLNNWSVGIKLIHGENSFVFTGDAELTAEYDILGNEIDISATVFHAGHHGSDTSNSEGLLKAVNPKYIVISCGIDNSYGHPHKEILDRINEYEIECYRTDMYGTIIARSDGLNINWAFTKITDKESEPTLTTAPTATPEPTPSPTPKPTQKVSVTVYITKTGDKYHTSGCSYLKKSKIAISLDDAKVSGYTPCSRCKP